MTQKTHPANREPLAIVGIGCRYPGGVRSAQEFWRFLVDGGDGFAEVPPDRWDAARFTDDDGSVPGRARPRQSAFLSGVSLEDFDAPFFGFSPREAESLDPQQRLLLEVGWEAFEDAGIPVNAWEKRRMGVYVGGFTLDNYIIQTGYLNRFQVNQFTGTSSTLGMLSNRLSYAFDFKGPSLTIDTACSSSLVAFHYACQDLWGGRADAAMVGGVNVILYPTVPVAMSKGGFLSPDSRSKAFDVTADGYARGEGAGMVILKPLSAAVRDGDGIYAVVHGSGVNQDGRTAGIASPNGESQAELIDTVLAESGVAADDVVLVEAHGTGTAIGDPTEVSALVRSLGQRPDGGRRYVGSVKGNIGHQEAGAGVAGVIKAALCLHNRQAVPQANLQEIDPELPLDEGGMEVPRAPAPLPATVGEPLACINSFGFGGSNAHAVLGAARGVVEAPAYDAAAPALLLVSARSEAGLIERARDLARYLEDAPEQVTLADVAHTLACRRDALAHRAAVLAACPAEAIEALEALAAEETHPALLRSEVSASGAGPVFVYTGMGPQWWAMGRSLFENEAVFRHAAEEADAAFQAHAGWSVLKEMLAEEAASRMTTNAVAQPANFVLQHALTVLLKHWGVSPASIVGHSVGEVGAALAAESITLQDAARVAYHRSRVQQTRAGQGRMLATGLSIATAQELADLYVGQVSLAAINGKTSTVLAGEADALDEIASGLDEQGIFNALVFGEVAYHSHQMDGLEEELLQALSDLDPSPPKIPLYSSVTGERVRGALHDAGYWWKNVRQPVRFHDALGVAFEDGHRVFVEVGPHPVLAGAMEQLLHRSGHKGLILPSLVRKADEREALLELLGALWGADATSPRWQELLPGNRVQLPAYPWQRQRLWRESRASQQARRGIREHPYLGLRTPDPLPSWETELGSTELTALRDHVVDGRPVFPAAAYLETFLAAVESLQPLAGFGLSDVRFDNLLHLGDDGSVALRTTSAGDHLTLHGRSLSDDGEWRPYAQARLVRQTRTSPAAFPVWGDDEGEVLDRAAAYRTLADMGLGYRPSFRTLHSARVSRHRVEGVVRLQAGPVAEGGLRCSPALVDGGLQLLALAYARSEAPPVPVSVQRVTWFGSPLGDSVHVHGALSEGDTGRLLFTDEAGAPLLELKGIRMARVPRMQSDADAESLAYHLLSWRPAETATEGPRSTAPLGELVFFGDGAEVLGNVVDTISSTEGGPTMGLFSGGAATEPDPAAGAALLEAARAMVSRDANGSLALVTRGAWRVLPGDSGAPGQAALWGIARTLRRERPGLALTCVDLDEDPGSLATLVTLLSHLPTGGEMAIRQGELFRREVTSTQVAAHTLDELPASVPHDTAAVLEVPGRPNLNGLRFRVQPRREPRGRELEVRFAAASLNFKDVLKAMGRIAEQSLRETFFHGALGMETAGTVVRVGPESDFTVGEDVIVGLRSGGVRTHATFTPEDAFVLRWGDLQLTPAQAAALPISFITAHYGLLHIGRLREGESVLLHSATGGVGHAAIQVARDAGARIFATAGTEEKRAYLTDLGLERVFDSRSLDFEDRVLEATGGQGVDVVLNFLPDALLHASLRVLAPFGRLVEIGKADIGANKGLPLADFERNLTFGAVDIDQMLAIRRDLFYSVAQEVKDGFERGIYGPIPVECTPADEVVDAFRTFAEGGHIGKRALTLDPGPSWALPRRPSEPPVRAGVSYLVTGGHGGLGLETAKWLVDQGANHLILVSRSAPESDAVTRLRAVAEERGGAVLSRSCDVGDRDAVDELLEHVATEAPTLAGIFHSAAVLADAVVDQQTEETLATALHAKALGALNLHRASVASGIVLDHFVLYSSVSGMLGNGGQANYAAANAYLDALAEHRRAQGLAGTSVAWGAVAEAGMVARDEAVARRLESRGIRPIPLERAFRHLRDILAGSPACVGVFDVDWERWGETVVLAPDDPAAPLVGGSRSEAQAASFAKRFSQAQPQDRLQVTQDFLKETLGRLLHLDEDKVSLETPLLEMGVDSLMSVDLELALEAGLGSGAPLVQLNIQESLAGLSTRVVDKLAEGGLAADAEEVDVNALSESEVDALLHELMDEPGSQAD